MIGPKIGLGIIILTKDDKVLVGKRKDCGKYGIPGGYLENFETWNEGASREVFEETNLKIPEEDLFVITVYNTMNKEENYHNIAVVMAARISDFSELKNMEPEKCEGWEFWDIKLLYERTEELFTPNKHMIMKFPKLLDIEYIDNVIKYAEKNKPYLINNI